MGIWVNTSTSTTTPTDASACLCMCVCMCLCLHVRFVVFALSCWCAFVGVLLLVCVLCVVCVCAVLCSVVAIASSAICLVSALRRVPRHLLQLQPDQTLHPLQATAVLVRNNNNKHTTSNKQTYTRSGKPHMSRDICLAQPCCCLECCCCV